MRSGWMPSNTKRNVGTEGGPYDIGCDKKNTSLYSLILSDSRMDSLSCRGDEGAHILYTRNIYRDGYETDSEIVYRVT